MPRPRRIEYEHAFYHVMNRGRARQTIFHDKRYFNAFLETLSEVQQRFQCVIHAYCLLGNHYHLLLETPNANLGRIMRHVNGVYTQRYNRLKKTDGPLFRGRYKAIIVDKDSYLLQLTRYIHRNPIDMKKKLVRQLEDYPWSSYPAYVAKEKSPDWLYREKTYQMLGYKHRYKGYASYVEKGVDDEIAHYYSRGNVASIVGDKDFKAWIYEEILPDIEAEDRGRVILSAITMQAIVEEVANYYHTEKEILTKVIKGPKKGNDARKIAMYLSQELASQKLTDIADCFNLNHAGSVSFITHQIRKRRQESKVFEKEINNLIKSIIKKAT